MATGFTSREKKPGQSAWSVTASGRAVSGVGLKPTLEFGLLRSEVLTARGYPEVDGDGPEVHPAIMYDFIGRSNRALWGSQKPPRIRTQPNHFNKPFKSDTA